MACSREICKICYEVNRVGFKVPNEVWKEVVPDQFNVLCLGCFTQLADEKMIPWDHNIQFFPVSQYTHLREQDQMMVDARVESGSLDHIFTCSTDWEC